MDNFWKGAFAPVRKSIGTVTFVSLADMTPRDWDWLDYSNIRTVAKNRIASMIARGQLRGFFQVKILEKAAKNEYFWPASPSMIAEFAESDNGFFRNQAEVEYEAVSVQALDDLMFIASLLPVWVLRAILQATKIYMEEQAREEVDKLTQEYMESIPQEAAVIIYAAIMAWVYSLEEAIALVEELPESDEQDEILDWIADRLALIEQARTRLAAGRGI